MKIKWKQLIIGTAIPLAVGTLAAFLNRGGMETFENMKQPLLSPPAWLFPVVWTILYTLMGISSYLIWNSETEEEVQKALTVYGYQLLVNFLWPTFFFSFQWYFFAFLWLLLLIGLVAVMIRAFYQISRTAAWLNIPYFLWLLFAGYLNFAIWRLN